QSWPADKTCFFFVILLRCFYIIVVLEYIENDFCKKVT
ncbi:unnamed protein product, partial [Arabidopsis halleri]